MFQRMDSSCLYCKRSARESQSFLYHMLHKCSNKGAFPLIQGIGTEAVRTGRAPQKSQLESDNKIDDGNAEQQKEQARMVPVMDAPPGQGQGRNAAQEPDETAQDGHNAVGPGGRPDRGGIGRRPEKELDRFPHPAGIWTGDAGKCGSSRALAATEISQSSSCRKR